LKPHTHGPRVSYPAGAEIRIDDAATLAFLQASGIAEVVAEN
jgi:hypothetical protein